MIIKSFNSAFCFLKLIKGAVIYSPAIEMANLEWFEWENELNSLEVVVEMTPSWNGH